MGVNFPDVRNVIIYGPSRSLLDILQEAGRAGRDTLPADVVINYYGQQLAHCDDEVKNFLKSETCYRVGAYRSLDPAVQPLSPAHDCCNLCSKLCKCASDGNSCTADGKPFEIHQQSGSPNVQARERQVSEEDKCTLEAALREIMMKHFDQSANVLGSYSSHGFSEALIKGVVDNCQKLFSLGDIFEDIDEVTFELTSSDQHDCLDTEEILSRVGLLGCQWGSWVVNEVDIDWI